MTEHYGPVHKRVKTNKLWVISKAGSIGSMVCAAKHGSHVKTSREQPRKQKQATRKEQIG